MNPPSAAPPAAQQAEASAVPPASPPPSPAGTVRVVAVGSQKGGVGKTTVTVALAAAAARDGHRALVVDVDPQASAYDLTEAMDEPSYRAVHELDPTQLATMREVGEFTRIFVDCPGSLEGYQVLEQVLACTDFALIPYDHQAVTWEPTRNTVEYVTERGVPYAVLLNNLDPRLTATHILDAWQRLDAAGIRSFRTFLRQYRAWPNSQKDRETIFQHGSGYARAARQDLLAVWAELSQNLDALGAGEA